VADTNRKLVVTTTVRDLASKALDKLGLRGKKAGTSIAWGFVKAQLAIFSFRAALRTVSRAFRSITSEVADYLDEMSKMSDRIGISVEGLSALRHVAELAGIEFRTFTMALQRQTRRVAEAAKDQGEAIKALQELERFGLPTARELARLAPDEQFIALAEAMEQVSDRGQRLALGFKLWDAEGAKLVQTFAAGTMGIREFIAEAKRLGIVVTDQQALIGVAFKDAITRFTAAMRGVKIAIGLELLPPLTRALDSLTKWISENRDEISRVLLDALGRIKDFVVEAIALVIRFGGEAYDTLVAIKKAAEDPLGAEKWLDDVVQSLGHFQAELRGVPPAFIEAMKTMEGAAGNTGKRLEHQFRKYVESLEKAFEKFKGRTDEVVVSPGAPDDQTITQWMRFRAGIDAAAKASEDFFQMLGSALVDSTASGLVGFMDAMIDRTKTLKEAFRDMVESMVRDFLRLGMQFAVRSAFFSIPGVKGSEAALAAAVPGGGGKPLTVVNMNQTINPSPGMDEQAVADLAADSVVKKLSTSHGYRSAIRSYARGGLY